MIQVTVLTDNYPQETSWTLTDECSSTELANGNGYDIRANSYSETFCVLPSKYTFVINDSYGDGKFVLCYNGCINCELSL